MMIHARRMILLHGIVVKIREPSFARWKRKILKKKKNHFKCVDIYIYIHVCIFIFIISPISYDEIFI